MLKYIVELIGTFIFLSVILISNGDPIYIGIALAAVIMFGGKISGGHFNPAVTWMSWLNGSKDNLESLMYIFSQVVGGTLAYLFYDSNKNILTKK